VGEDCRRVLVIRRAGSENQGAPKNVMPKQFAENVARKFAGYFDGTVEEAIYSAMSCS
jgi:hypothetical protein